MAESVINKYFPSQVVSDLEKMSYDYGLKVAKAIQHEWWSDTYGKASSRHRSNISKFHRLRLYARGEQSVQKYKDELSINGDLSYLNLDWTPVPIVSKFVDIVVNGIAERLYDVKAYSQDPFGVKKRTQYMENIQKDMKLKEFDQFVRDKFGIETRDSEIDELPETPDELALHMQLEYKQAIEIAEEQAINMLMRGNQYDLIKRRFYSDLVVCGIGAVKTCFNTSEGVTIDYVDPANLVYSYTDSPYFDDIYYVGEVKSIPINELVKQFPYLDKSELEDIAKSSSGTFTNYYGHPNRNDADNNKVDILYFNYKTYMNEVYKVKKTSTGSEKAIKKDDSFNPPSSDERYEKMHRNLECLYEGALILGTDKLIKWEKAANMMRSKSDYTKVKMNYAIVAPRMYEGRIDSLVNRITGFADMIQITHLKIQQVLSRMTPDGVFLDIDGLAEVDLGNGTNYNPQEALNMFFQTGSIVGRSMTMDGDGNAGKIPIQEIQNGAGGQKMQSLISTYNYYLQMIRDVTGLNEATDGSTPAERSLVGVQKMAAANSNTATRHILNSGMFLTAEVAEQLSLRVSDIIEYSPTRDAFIESIGAHNVATLEEMANLHLYDFGIFLELEPDEEEKQMLENNIQAALSQGSIELEDSIDLRAIKNVKLANQLLKLRRKKKGELDQKNQLEQTQAQGAAQAEASKAAADAEIKKNESISKSQLRLEEVKTQGKAQILAQEAEIKRDLMQQEFQYNMQLKQLEAKTKTETQILAENRKDDRTKMQATQQSRLIDQRTNRKEPTNFESANDNLGGMNLSNFNPR